EAARAEELAVIQRALEKAATEARQRAAAEVAAARRFGVEQAPKEAHERAQFKKEEDERARVLACEEAARDRESARQQARATAAQTSSASVTLEDESASSRPMQEDGDREGGQDLEGYQGEGDTAPDGRPDGIWRWAPLCAAHGERCISSLPHQSPDLGKAAWICSREGDDRCSFSRKIDVDGMMRVGNRYHYTGTKEDLQSSRLVIEGSLLRLSLFQSGLVV
ncbi:unnamed protein product, partial [Pylaiella littoralis]